MPFTSALTRKQRIYLLLLTGAVWDFHFATCTSLKRFPRLKLANILLSLYHIITICATACNAILLQWRCTVTLRGFSCEVLVEESLWKSFQYHKFPEKGESGILFLVTRTQCSMLTHLHLNFSFCFPLFACSGLADPLCFLLLKCPHLEMKKRPFSAPTNTDSLHLSLFYVACSCEMMSLLRQQFVRLLLIYFIFSPTGWFCFWSVWCSHTFYFTLVLCAVLMFLTAPNLIQWFPFFLYRGWHCTKVVGFK